ncbi:TIGR02099 family protein [Ectothiorhodospira mobilis]|uniref:TIGR02099 family protein n=1 Tax=Ectothiorhodospira mobilis TaxID=195064 RepID=A0A1I4S2P3_ECTMO|nr:YhdP family protein [Ectothiorhodospira mobilis]SFM58671.1 TIGR02099 family protein [Ectothiorhodospira mobilis]
MAGKIPSRLARAGAAAVLSLAALILSLRLLLPQVEGLAPTLEAELSGLLERPVRVGQLQARWGILSPRIRVDDLTILDPGGGVPLLRSERVEMTLDLPASLWQGRPVFDRVRVRGADLHVLRDEQGRIRVLGGGASAGGVGADADLLALLAGNRFLLEDSRLRWEDRLLDIDDRFEALNLWVALEADRLRLAGEVSLPRRLGQALRVSMDLHHEDGTQWDGRGYLHARGLRLAGLPQATRSRLGVEAGILDASLWLRWERGRLVRIQTRLGAAQLQPAAGSGPPLDLQGHLLWNRTARGWTLRGEDLDLRREGVGWPPGSGFDLTWTQGPQGERLQARIDHLRLDDVAPLLAGQTLFPGTWRERLARLRPGGVLSGVQLDLARRGEGLPSGRAQGRFRGVRLAPDGRLPGVSGLDGGFDLSAEGGRIWVEARDARLELPGLWERPVPVEALEGVLDWIPGPGGGVLESRRLMVRNADLAVDARGRVLLGQRPQLDLAVEFRDGDVRAVPAYLPRGVPPQLRRWLQRALEAGRIRSGGMVFRGAPGDFPFREGEGVFQLAAELDDVRLAYHSDWPPMEDLSARLAFHGQAMEVEVREGRMAGLGIQQARGEIPDLGRPRLQVRGKARGGLREYLGLVRASPLAARAGDWLPPVRAEAGEGALDLDLDIPLLGEGRTRVAGRLALTGGRFVHGGRGWTLKAVDGNVAFTRETLAAQGVTARLQGIPLTLDARRGPNAGLTVEARGAQAVSDLLEPAPEALRRRLGGTVAWRARLHAPEDPGAMQLELESDLAGLVSDLPAPLDKPGGMARPLQVRAPLMGDTWGPARLSLAGGVEGVFTPGLLSGAGRGALCLGGGEPDLPAEGLAVTGRTGPLDLGAWRDLVAGLGRTGMGEPPALALDLSAEALTWGRLRLEEAALQGHRDAGGWGLHLDAPAAVGWIRIPSAQASMDPLVADLDHLDLDALGAPGAIAAGGRPDPGGLPPLRLQSDRLTWKGRTLEDAVLSTQPVPGGVEILRAQGRTPGGDLQLALQGDWRQTAGAGPRTTLEAELTAGDLGRGLDALGLQHPFQGGQGRMGAELSWPGPPWRWDVAEMRGSAVVRLRDGQLAEVEPGAGRLLGLFSLELLPRRLNLDFRDLVRRGFAYDRMEGDFSLRDGGLHTPDLHIQGPAARIRIQGTTDLVQRSYDQRILVTPSVGGTLPLAGALLGGPVAGLAVFVFDRVTGVGEAIDEAARVEYRVTGPWGDPRVEAVARAGNDDGADATPSDGGRQ